jgi:hypothetical protein
MNQLLLNQLKISLCRIAGQIRLGKTGAFKSSFSIAMASLLSVGALTVNIPNAEATGIGIQPANVELAANPGSTIRQTIKVGNLRTDKGQNFIVGIAEWSLDENGQLKLSPPSANSAASWTRFAPARFSLRAAEAQTIVVDITIPAKIDAREYRVAILVTNPQPSPEEMKKLNGVWNATQVSTLMYLVPPGVTTKPIVSNVAFVPDAVKGAMFQADIKNEGSAHARLIAVTTFADESGKVVHSADAQIVLMDAQSRTWRSAVKADHLPQATYKLNWKLYNVFDPKRPNERAGELMQEQNWTWTKVTAAIPLASPTPSTTDGQAKLVPLPKSATPPANVVPR